MNKKSLAYRLGLAGLITATTLGGNTLLNNPSSIPDKDSPHGFEQDISNSRSEEENQLIDTLNNLNSLSEVKSFIESDAYKRYLKNQIEYSTITDDKNNDYYMNFALSYSVYTRLNEILENVTDSITNMDDVMAIFQDLIFIRQYFDIISKISKHYFALNTGNFMKFVAAYCLNTNLENIDSEWIAPELIRAIMETPYEDSGKLSHLRFALVPIKIFTNYNNPYDANTNTILVFYGDGTIHNSANSLPHPLNIATDNNALTNFFDNSKRVFNSEIHRDTIPQNGSDSRTNNVDRSTSGR